MEEDQGEYPDSLLYHFPSQLRLDALPELVDVSVSRTLLTALLTALKANGKDRALSNVCKRVFCLADKAKQMMIKSMNDLFICCVFLYVAWDQGKPFSMCRFSGCVLWSAADRPPEAGVLDQTGLPGDPQRRSQEPRGSGAGEAALNIEHAQQHTEGHTHTQHHTHVKALAPRCSYRHKMSFHFIFFIKRENISYGTVLDLLDSEWQ